MHFQKGLGLIFSVKIIKISFRTVQNPKIFAPAAQKNRARSARPGNLNTTPGPLTPVTPDTPVAYPGCPRATMDAACS